MSHRFSMRRLRAQTLLALTTSILVSGLAAGAANAQELILRSGAAPRRPTKEQALTRELGLALKTMGHRNWIVIADSAYPEQASAGIKTFASDMGQLEVVKQALQAVKKAPHVRGIVYLDEELKYVPEDDAPGIAKYRESLSQLLEGQTTQTQLHEDTIHALDEAAKTFRVLIIKTDMVLPYTSVFIQLDCGYWSGEAENRMREKMKEK